MTVGQEIRRLRAERRWSQAKLGVLSGTGPSAISQIETGRRNPSAATLQRIAGALEVEVADLFPKVEAPLPFEDAPLLERSLEELHAAAKCSTDWLIIPEKRWVAIWRANPSPRKALKILRETLAEFSLVKPLMAEQEKGLPMPRRVWGGRYRQAWARLFGAITQTEAVGVSYGVIGPGEDPEDLARKLGDEPLEGLPFAS
jgi:transcriptional regulator with XRE-family HTH domain